MIDTCSAVETDSSKNAKRAETAGGFKYRRYFAGSVRIDYIFVDPKNFIVSDAGLAPEEYYYVSDHSSIQMTVDTYGHLIPSSNRQAVNALDENAPKRTPSAPTQNEKAATR